ncbi:MAG: hypothetical protein RL418_824 [Actinomycetota bacterium]
MQLLKRPFVRTLLKYFAMFLAVYLGYLVYAMDRTPPELAELTISTEVLDPANGIERFEYSGKIIDDRSVSKAEFVCVSEQGDEFILVLVTSGANRYKAGFGRISSSPDWLGRWDGRKTEVNFEGIGRLPGGTPTLECDWEARLGDNLGNNTVIDTGYSLSIISPKP